MIHFHIMLEIYIWTPATKEGMSILESLAALATDLNWRLCCDLTAESAGVVGGFPLLEGDIFEFLLDILGFQLGRILCIFNSSS